MPEREKSSAQQIVPVATQALVMRSAALAARGLRDLSRESNWLLKKVFSGRAPQVAISPAGQVCALSPLVRHGSESIALYDVELGVPLLALAVPGDPGVSEPGKPAAFAWSPTGQNLVAAWGGWLPELHAFDLNAKKFLGAFGDYANFPSHLVWSDAGNYFAANSTGEEDARVRLWEISRHISGEMPFASESAGELTLATCRSWPEWSETAAGENDEQSSGQDFEESAALAGFGRAAFSPDEGSLACVVEIEGEWADDSIAVVEVPSLRKQSVFHAQGHITDLAWTYDSSQIIFCAAGQASRLAADTMEPEPLPFGAELCVCHPQLPICLCFSSWLKNSAKGRLFLVDLNRLKIFDEHAAEGVVDLRWSLDGSKAYAITSDGLAYLYEPPLL
jgi:hypothetical protein